MNSGPLSERTWSGVPRVTMTSASTSITSSLPSRRATRIARHSRVYSSMSVSRRTVRPSCVRVLTKSQLHTWFACSGRKRPHDPSLSHNRRRGFWRCGTFSPSRRQMRATRSLPTCHPAVPSNAVTRRQPYRPY